MLKFEYFIEIIFLYPGSYKKDYVIIIFENFANIGVIRTMNKTVYLHVGPHKTGTTTIQVSLFMNEQKLKKAGVMCPKSGRTFQRSGGHHNLAWELWNHPSTRFDPKAGTWRDLLKEINDENQIDKIILSSEDFNLLTHDPIVEIKDLLKNFETKIILYLRKQDEALQSTWVTHVRNDGVLPPIPSFKEWLELKNYRTGNTDFIPMIKKWEKVFARENLILRTFEPSLFNGSLFSDFLSLCGVNINHLNEIPRANISPGTKTMEAMRMIKNNIDFSEINRSTWNYITRSITEYGDRKGWNQDKINYLDHELSEKIMRLHEESNLFVAKEYFKRDYLFTEKRGSQKNVSTFVYDEFERAEIIGLFSFVLLKLDKKIKKTLV